jgi:hypothetical protein
MMEKQPGFDDDFDRIFEEAQKAAETPRFPDLVCGTQIKTNELPLPVEVISGLLSRGEKGELAGGSKSFKTWSLIHQALAISSGCGWWGFPTPTSNVIFLNLEIPPPFFEARVRSVALALDIDIPHNFHVWHLRRSKLGDPARWSYFLDSLAEKCADVRNPYLTSDPIYKLLGGRNENAAGDVSALLEQLDDMVERADGANFFGHHFSKGNQAGKEAIDRASGSGVFARDPDSILTMTRHEKEGAFVVESILRNHPPIEPFVVEWKYPIFERNQILDPEALKQPKARDSNKYDIHMLVYWLRQDGPLSTTALLKVMKDETGISASRFYELLKEAEGSGVIKHDPHNLKRWIPK